MKVVKKKISKAADSKKVPFAIRTIVRRPTSTPSSTTTQSLSSSVTSSGVLSSGGSRAGGAPFIVKKGRPVDGNGRGSKRVRLRDSLLARVQGKYRARSTTAKPEPEAPRETEENENAKVSFMIKFYFIFM